MSVEMTNGLIMFRFGFGDEDETNITTVNTYNTNKWVKVKARRNKTIGNCYCYVSEIAAQNIVECFCLRHHVVCMDCKHLNCSG
jgi:hypothetical protein